MKIEDKRLELVAIEIDNYRQKNGKNWRSKLFRFFLFDNNTNSHLQFFRNFFHLSVLTKIKASSSKKDIVAILKKYLDKQEK